MVFDSQKPFDDQLGSAKITNNKSETQIIEDAVMPPELFLRNVTKTLQTLLGLELIGFDLIVDSITGNYLVIDVNYWPSKLVCFFVFCSFIFILCLFLFNLCVFVFFFCRF
jgi:hypothetical protein